MMLAQIKSFILLGSLTTLFFVPLITSAANYSVSPLILDLELEKREIIRKEITITNQENRQLRIYPTVNEVSVDSDGAIESFLEPSMVDDRSSSITSWIQISRTRIEIPPGGTHTIPVTIKVHPEVTPGDYHAVIGFADASNYPEAQAKVMRGIAPGVVVRASVDKVQSQFLRLDRFLVERLVTDADSGIIRYTLSNPGEDPVTPAGEIILYDNSGTEVYALPVNTEAAVVPPGGQIELTDQVPPDFKMGKYKAFLSVEYGENLTASVHDTAFFYVLPLQQLIIIFAAVLVLAILIALYVHRRYDIDEEYDANGVATVPMYIRTDRSESKDHDIDLKPKN